MFIFLQNIFFLFFLFYFQFAQNDVSERGENRKVFNPKKGRKEISFLWRRKFFIMNLNLAMRKRRSTEWLNIVMIFLTRSRNSVGSKYSQVLWNVDVSGARKTQNCFSFCFVELSYLIILLELICLVMI